MARQRAHAAGAGAAFGLGELVPPAPGVMVIVVRLWLEVVEPTKGGIVVLLDDVAAWAPTTSPTIRQKSAKLVKRADDDGWFCAPKYDAHDVA